MSASSAKPLPCTAVSVRRLPWLLLLLLGMLLVWAVASQARAVVVPPGMNGFEARVSPEPDHPQLPMHMVAICESGAEASRMSRQRPASLPAFPAQLVAPATPPPQRVFMAAASDTLLLHAVARAQRYPLAPHLLLNPGHAPPRARTA